MARPGFYNDNAYRRYPLLPGEPYELRVTSNQDGTGTQAADIVLSDKVFIDFGCIVGLAAGYVDSRDSLQLAYIHRSGNTLTIAIRSTCPGLEDWELRFVRDWSLDEEYLISDSVATYAGVGETDVFPFCAEDAIWSGWLATGDMSEFGSLIADGFYATARDVDVQLEPALIQNLRDTFVRSVSLANRDRTRVDAPAGCEESSSASADEPPAIWVGETCMTGDLRMRAGYNCRIRQENRTNTIEISAGVGAGAGQPCDEVPLSPEESSISGELLTGGPHCHEVLKTINGVGGRVVRIEGGDGVRVRADQDDPHRLVVDVDLHNLQVCNVLEESLSSAGSS